LCVYEVETCPLNEMLQKNTETKTASENKTQILLEEMELREIHCNVSPQRNDGYLVIYGERMMTDF